MFCHDRHSQYATEEELNAEEALETHPPPVTVENIVADIKQEEEQIDENKEEEIEQLKQEEIEDRDTVDPPTHKEALKALDVLEQYAFFRGYEAFLEANGAIFSVYKESIYGRRQNEGLS